MLIVGIDVCYVAIADTQSATGIHAVFRPQNPLWSFTDVPEMSP